MLPLMKEDSITAETTTAATPEDPLSDFEVARARQELRKQSKLVRIPGIYRDRGHLLLTLSRHSDHINYVDLRDGSYSHMDVDVFLRGAVDHKGRIVEGCFGEAPEGFEYSPHYLALNLLARAAEGSFSMSVRVKRRLIAMATKEELMKLSERALGREYSRVMGLPRPVQKISATPAGRERYVDDILKKLSETASTEKASEAAGGAAQAEAGSSANASSDAQQADPQNPPTSDAGASTATGNPPAVDPNSITEEGAASMSKKGKGSTKPKKEKQESTALVYAKSSGPNPFRESTKKAKAYKVFQDGGERASVIAKVVKLGVTEATASTWVYTFSKADRMKSIIAKSEARASKAAKREKEAAERRAKKAAEKKEAKK